VSDPFLSNVVNSMIFPAATAFAVVVAVPSAGLLAFGDPSASGTILQSILPIVLASIVCICALRISQPADEKET